MEADIINAVLLDVDVFRYVHAVFGERSVVEHEWIHHHSRHGLFCIFLADLDLNTFLIGTPLAPELEIERVSLSGLHPHGGSDQPVIQLFVIVESDVYYIVHTHIPALAVVVAVDTRPPA